MNIKKDTTLKIRISTQDKQSIKDQAHKEQSTLSNYVRTKIMTNEKRN